MGSVENRRNESGPRRTMGRHRGKHHRRPKSEQIATNDERTIAVLAVRTGIAPRELMETPTTILLEIVRVLQEQDNAR